MDKIFPPNDPNRVVKIAGLAGIGCVVLCGCVGSLLLVVTWLLPLVGGGQ